MQIDLTQALGIARIQKEVGVCSCNGMALVLLYDEIERLKETTKGDYALAYNKLFEEFTESQLEVARLKNEVTELQSILHTFVE